MRPNNHFTVPPGWRLLLKDLGISSVDVLRRAGLPDDLLFRDGVTLDSAQYFEFWRGLEQESGDLTLPIKIGEAISMEAFDVPIFAAMCSPDLNRALRRLSRFKRLIAPMALHVTEGPTETALEIEFLEEAVDPPRCLIATELVFFVQLARLATRERIEPVRVASPYVLEPKEAYVEFFGRAVEKGSRQTVAFSAEDARRPFLTSNAKMWEFFQPELRKRLSELDQAATMVDRVHGALLELLPSGEASLSSVSKKLAVSTRTLQRRLGQEEKSFQWVLDSTREQLARHYLSSSTLSATEISFLLGFENPSSFYRAFQGWTGETSDQARRSYQSAVC